MEFIRYESLPDHLIELPLLDCKLRSLLGDVQHLLELAVAGKRGACSQNLAWCFWETAGVLSEELVKKVREDMRPPSTALVMVALRAGRAVVVSERQWVGPPLLQ